MENEGVGMSTDIEQASRLLRGLEDGGLAAAEARVLAQDLDPVLVHVILRFLRTVYPASDPAASAVLDRVVRLTSADPAIVQKAKEGERDPVSQWFADEHSFAEFRGRGRELLDLIVDKLES
jgi:hypothetical protein